MGKVPVLTEEIGIWENEIVRLGFLLVEVVKMQLPDKAGKFTETEVLRDNLVFQSVLIFNKYILSIEIPTYNRMVELILDKR